MRNTVKEYRQIAEQEIAHEERRQAKRRATIIKRESEHRDRRERIATAAMAGMLADSSGHASIASYVADAVALADALITELDKPKEGGA